MSDSTAQGPSHTVILPLPQDRESLDPAENKEDPRGSSPAHNHHSRKCKICRHPDREAIEEEYRQWGNPAEIAREYEIPEWSLYRHIHAVGLISRRRENLRIILDRILERGAEVPVTGNEIIRAVRAQCCLTDRNQWVEPARKIIYVHQETHAREANKNLIASENDLQSV